MVLGVEDAECLVEVVRDHLEHATPVADEVGQPLPLHPVRPEGGDQLRPDGSDRVTRRVGQSGGEVVVARLPESQEDQADGENALLTVHDVEGAVLPTVQDDRPQHIGTGRGPIHRLSSFRQVLEQADREVRGPPVRPLVRGDPEVLSEQRSHGLRGDVLGADGHGESLSTSPTRRDSDFRTDLPRGRCARMPECEPSGFPSRILVVGRKSAGTFQSALFPCPADGAQRRVARIIHVVCR